MNAFTAAILSLLAPGAGQIYNGQYLKAAVLAGAVIFGKSLILPLCLRAFAPRKKETGLKLILFFNYVYIALVLYAAADAGLCAGGFYAVNLAAAILSAVAIISARKNSLQKNLFSMISAENYYFDFVRPQKKQISDGKTHSTKN